MKVESKFSAVASASKAGRRDRQAQPHNAIRGASFFPVVAALLGLVSTVFAADIGSLRKALENRSPAAAGIVDANTNPHGAPYGVWGAQWWQWFFSLQVHDAQGNITHPIFTTGEVDCSIGQSGDVWFLAGNITGGSTLRSCSIPRNTALFFPILNAVCDNTGFDQPGNLTLPQLQACAASGSDPAPDSMHVSIDGATVPVTPSNRGAAAFQYALPNTDNFWQFFGAQAPGAGWPYGNTPFNTVVAPAASDGYWLMVNPLPPGRHTINFGGTAATPYGPFSLDITYTLTII